MQASLDHSKLNDKNRELKVQRDELARKHRRLLKEVSKSFEKVIEESMGPVDEVRKCYTDQEWRVLKNEYRYRGLYSIMHGKCLTREMVEAVKEDIDGLREYMESKDWQRDYEADERGELEKVPFKGVLSQDGLYDLLEVVDRFLA